LEDVREGGKALAGRSDIFKARQVEDAVVLEVGSGEYTFESACSRTK
jgi:hypothetical protein